MDKDKTLIGTLSAVRGLSGKILIPTEHKVYDGEYEVTPTAFTPQTLNTADKVLKDDIVITEVPYFETSNTSNGQTVYIAKESAMLHGY